MDREYWTKGLDSGSGRRGSGHYFALAVGAAYLLVASLLCRLLSLVPGSGTKPASGNLSILAVGPFFSENWTAAHLDALCESGCVDKVAVITPRPFDAKPKREFVVFSERIARFFGSGISRAFAAWRYARRERPDLVIGYHLPWNGVVALLAARLIGCKACYFAVGGPAELIGGGRYSEHALFSRLGADSPFLEHRLLAMARRFDAILTMGSKSEAYFRDATGCRHVCPMAVGIEPAIFAKRDAERHESCRYDVVAVGRHSRIKRVDVLLKAIARLAANDFRLNVAVVGDGELRPDLERQASDLGIAERVHFAGWVDDVEAYLHDAKVFAMTSASEGLPHSLIESMMAGLPAVISDVGEISDLVENRETGFLVAPDDDAIFACRLRELLSDADLLAHCSENASAQSRRYSVTSRTRLWDSFLAALL